MPSNPRRLAAPLFWIPILTWLAAPLLAPAAVVHVSVAGDDATGDGSTGAPFATIQRGIDASVDGDEVLVAAGTYTGDGNTNVRFRGKAILVRSERGPWHSIIDCESQEGRRGFVFEDREGPDSILDGFMIRNGRGVRDPLPGGGISASYAGAIYVADASPVIRNCILRENRVTTNGESVGGAIVLTGGSATIRDCSFESNTSRGYGGAAALGNGADVTFERCTFTWNQAYILGGAVQVFEDSRAVLHNCVLSANRVYEGIFPRPGSAVGLNYGTADLVHCSVLDGHNDGGGAIANNFGVVNLRSTLLARNSGANFGPGGAIRSQGNNLSDDFSRPLFGPFDRIGVDPLVEPTGGPSVAYALLDGSPAIDAARVEDAPADDARGAARPFDGDGDGDARPDIGAYERRTVSAIPVPTMTPMPPPRSVYVAVGGNDETGLGSPAAPFATIQRGIDVCIDGDEVVVTPGTYLGAGNRNCSFGGRSIVVRSSAGPNETILDCENLGRAFQFVSGETPAAVLQGFTITRGHGLASGSSLVRAGAIYCWSSSPTIRACVFRQNRSTGIEFALVAPEAAAAAIYFARSSSLLSDCLFEENEATGVGTTYLAYGGALAVWIGSDIRVERCVFERNRIDSGLGGAVNVDATSTFDAIDSVFSENAVEDLEDEDGGGAVHADGLARFHNCTLIGNTALSGGALHAADAGWFVLENTLLARNGPNGSVVGLVVSNGNNLADDATVALGGPYDRTGIDPLVGPMSENGGPVLDYALLDGSPAIDAGRSEGAPATDARGEPRPFDGDGNGVADVDIGAYERRTVSALPVVTLTPGPTLSPSPSPSPTPHPDATRTPTPSPSPSPSPTPVPSCETFGSLLESFTGTSRFRGNIVSVPERRVLTEFSMRFSNSSFGGSLPVTFLVLSAPSLAGPWESRFALSGNRSLPFGTDDFSSGPIFVELEPDMFHAIGVAWFEEDLTWHRAPASLPRSWEHGTLEAIAIADGVTPPLASGAAIQTAFLAEHAMTFCMFDPGDTPTPSPSPTDAVSPSPSPSPTVSPSASPSASPPPSPGPSPTSSPTAFPSASPTSTATRSPTPSPSSSPSPTATSTAPASPTASPSASPTPTPSASPTPTPSPVSSLVNLSTRGYVATGDDVMIPGFIVEGSGTKRLLLSGVGPDLASHGVNGTLADPALVLLRGQNVAASNDDWESSPDADAIRATGLAPNLPAEAAILVELGAGEYTALLHGADLGSGIGLVQVFDLGGEARLRNISTRLAIGEGDRVMIAGVVVGGTSPRRVLVRGLGPTLASFGVADALPDPRLDLFGGAGGSAPVASNDDWREGDEAGVLATGLQPPNDAEPALLVELPPGSYTAILSGVGGGRGVGLVEIYDVGAATRSAAESP